VLPGDVITRIDSEAVTSAEQLLLRIASFGAGDAFTLGLLRDGEPLTADLVVGAGPESSGGGVPALEAVDGGVLVRTVAPGSPLDEAGVLPGDLVVRVRDRDAPSPRDMDEALALTEPGDFALLVVRRDGRQRVLAIPGLPPADAAR